MFKVWFEMLSISRRSMKHLCSERVKQTASFLIHDISPYAHMTETQLIFSDTHTLRSVSVRNISVSERIWFSYFSRSPPTGVMMYSCFNRKRHSTNPFGQLIKTVWLTGKLTNLAVTGLVWIGLGIIKYHPHHLSSVGCGLLDLISASQ